MPDAQANESCFGAELTVKLQGTLERSGGGALEIASSELVVVGDVVSVGATAAKCPCVPDCSGQQCGEDGCGGDCGACDPVANATVACEAGQCAPTCVSGYHKCAGACVADDAPAHCGSQCAPCPGDPSGVATCDGSSCGIDCADGYHLCDGACSADDSPATCGALCSPCPVKESSVATCEGGQCGLKCDDGFHECGPGCVPETSTSWCGASCTACPPPLVGTAACDGVQCVYTCPAGYAQCANLGCCPVAEVVEDTPIGEKSRLWMEIDSDGHPHISFYDGNEGDEEPRYAHNDGVKWTIEVVASGDSKQGEWNALALDGSDTPHILYQAGHPARDLMHATRAAGAWTIEVADGVGICGYNPAVFIDDAGTLHVSHHTASIDQVFRPRYSTKEAGGAWQSEWVGKMNAAYGRTGVMLDDQGRVHVALAASFPVKVGYSYRTDSGSWVDKLLGPTDGGVGLTMRPDSKSRPKISCVSDKDLRLGENSSGFPGSVSFVYADPYENALSPTSLALGPDDTPHISYRPWAPKGLRYAWRDGSTWHRRWIAVADGEDIGVHHAIGLSDQGQTVHVAYLNATTQRLMYVEFPAP